MNNRENRRYEMFHRSKAFGQTNTADFPPDGEAARRFTNLSAILIGLDKARASQQGGGTTAKSVLMDALKLDIQNITRTARAMDQDTPGLADKFPAPTRGSDADLLAAADNILARLSPDPKDDAGTKTAKSALVAKFVAHELPADFVTHLIEDRAAIDLAQNDIESDNEEGVSSTSAVGRLIKEGMKEINYLDAIMHNKYSRDPDKLRAWKSASHIEREPQREKKPVEPVTVTVKPA